ncbi:MAG TPA: helix-hairpin-helix domain-containing protein [Fimbriimonadaceae bacterium]|jgi:competence protein ComEA
MFMQIDPKERLGYGVVAILIAAIAGVIGYKSSHKPAVDIASTPAVTQKSQAASAIVVHVVGEVKRPGVYNLPAESRAVDAVKAAGGALPEADLESINLAAKLTDGQQIRISQKGSEVASSPEQGQQHGHGGKITSGTISLNSGSAEELQTVPGIGPTTAQKIVTWRSAHGSFSKIEDLKAIGGIGDKKLETMRPFLRL